MSLLNDMLRDLSSQHRGTQPSEDQEVLLADSGLARSENFPWLLILTVFVLVLVLALVGQSLWRSGEVVEPMPALALTAVEPVALVADISAPPKAEVEAEVERETPDVIQASAPLAQAQVPVPAETQSPTEIPVLPAQDTEQAMQAAEIALQKVIDQLLQLAERALQRDRLAAPADDNASDYFAQVLSLRANDPRAMLGLQRVNQRYVELVEQALAQQQPARARQLLDRALELSPDEPRLTALAAALDTESAQLVAVPQVQELELPAVDDVPEPTPADPVVRVADTRPAVSGESSMSITPSPQWRDRQAEEEARALILAGDKAGAIAYLEDFLGRDPEAAKASARLLCHIYLEQGDLAQVDRLLKEAQDWPVNEHTRLRALWMQASGDEAAARRLLETHLANAERDEAYRALLARLYYSGGEYHQAVSSYRRLLDSFGEKPGYWLGMALALDALGQGSSALVAYERSLMFAPQEAAVTNYIESRIRALSR